MYCKHASYIKPVICKQRWQRFSLIIDQNWLCVHYRMLTSKPIIKRYPDNHKQPPFRSFMCWTCLSVAKKPKKIFMACFLKFLWVMSNNFFVHYSFEWGEKIWCNYYSVNDVQNIDYNLCCIKKIRLLPSTVIIQLLIRFNSNWNLNF